MQSMMISPRDGRILREVGRFGQLATSHIRSLEFHANKSLAPCNAVLLRLEKSKLLRTTEKRGRGGWAGGSAENVYQLGQKGWTYLRRDGKYWPYRSIDVHRLAIADAYVMTREAERAGELKIDEYITEPASHRRVAGVDVTPDLYMSLAFPQIDEGARLKLWLEVDMGTERHDKIADKLARYWHAYQHWHESDNGRLFPLVVFVAVDELRERELNAIVREGDERARRLFDVTTPESFPQVWKNLPT